MNQRLSPCVAFGADRIIRRLRHDGPLEGGHALGQIPPGRSLHSAAQFTQRAFRERLALERRAGLEPAVEIIWNIAYLHGRHAHSICTCNLPPDKHDGG